ncbi:sucrase ferredoxin [Nocardia sp. NBC_00565]|uniref:sucrase ferredoxin n=1 Tax=Nocardia sp. NBC_00565 TaxID=2975993 RepID=UPI002E803019|nr:sucrase ferredoxin [Nocardia sp. NBC_00565]WUC02980.1 sucrase ferredoxin [Nocardia sp. NBC_00565]
MTGFAGMLCSAAAAVDVPLSGTATRVTGWLCVEQPGAWGRDVIGDEVLGQEITAELAARTSAAGVRPTLIRRPGRTEFTGARTVLIASSRQQGAWCERLEITDLGQLLDLDLDLLNGPPPGIGAPVRDPLILVCAHGKRDQCCALFGRPIAANLAADYPDQVWECSHTGGHRFAPAMVLLPSGLTYGRVDTVAAIAAVEAVRRDAVSLSGLRGRSAYRPIEQVAELAVREQVSAGIDDLTVHLESDSTATDPTLAGTAVVAHRDGRRWRVTARTVGFPPRQASCGAAPKPVTAIVADQIQPLTAG